MEIPHQDIMLNDINYNGEGELFMPGFRFHPTEEELVGFYLKRMVEGKSFDFNIIETLDLYRYDPWELPGLARVGEREWYFFVPRDKKHPNGGRPNRITVSGYWKATGSDRPVRNEGLRCIGLRKTLVFYKGRAPRGQKTDWVMNEYRMPDSNTHRLKTEIVLCRIYRKATSLKSLEEAAMGEGSEDQKRGGARGKSSWDSGAANGSPDLHMTESEVSSLTKCDFNCQATYEDSELSDLVGFHSLTDDGSSCSYGMAANPEPTNIGHGHVAMGMKPAKVKPPQLELPKLCGHTFSEVADNQMHSWQRSPLGDGWTPSALLCTPIGFNLWGHTGASDSFDQPCSF